MDFSMYFSDAFDFSSLQHAQLPLPMDSCREWLFILPLLRVLPACPFVPLLLSFASGLSQQALSLKLLLGTPGRGKRGDPLEGL